MKKFFEQYFFPLLVIAITGSICLLNYTPGTWLTGWDTLHPEFDFWLNFKRLIFGVWRGDQGLGAVAAHSHMSELPRLLLLWIFFLGFLISQCFVIYMFFFVLSLDR